MKSASTGLPGGSRRVQSTEARPADAQAGFTLIETLTALTILAIALVSLFEAQGTGLRTAGNAADYAKARILGQSLLAETAATWRGGLLRQGGKEGAYDWSIDVSRAPGAPSKSQTKWGLHQIRVTIAWGAARSIELDTLKLGLVRE